MPYHTKEEIFRKHMEESDENGFHVDGCFYCGGNHPSDVCMDPERNHFWEINYAKI